MAVCFQVATLNAVFGQDRAIYNWLTGWKRAANDISRSQTLRGLSELQRHLTV
jgi:hypothetical protein